jgi:hypothetical protein
MTALIVALGTAVLLLGLLVAGLLRSHAEILRRLHTLDGGHDDHDDHDGHPEFLPAPGVAPARDEFPEAGDLAGLTPDGDAIAIGVAGAGHHSHNTLGGRVWAGTRWTCTRMTVPRTIGRGPRPPWPGWPGWRCCLGCSQSTP